MKKINKNAHPTTTVSDVDVHRTELTCEESKAWNAFRDAGLLWFINRTLHLFGWVIVYHYHHQVDADTGIDIVPERLLRVIVQKTAWRGFDGATEEAGYTKVTKYLNENVDKLLRDVEGQEV